MCVWEGVGGGGEGGVNDQLIFLGLRQVGLPSFQGTHYFDPLVIFPIFSHSCWLSYESGLLWAFNGAIFVLIFVSVSPSLLTVLEEFSSS